MCAINIQTVVATPRLKLRPLMMSDAGRIADLIDFGIARMTSSNPHPYRLGDAEAFLDRTVAGVGRGWRYAIETDGEGLVGVIGLEAKSGPLLELGYWLGQPHWGRGYASEAAGAVLQWARDTQDVRVVVAGRFEDNPASGRVLEKVGFLYTGVVEPRFSRARGEIVNTRMMVWLA